MTIQKKICSRCHETKPVDEFHVCKNNIDGRNHYCKFCMRDYRREKDGRTGKVRVYRVKDGNQDAILLEHAKTYNAAHPVRVSDDIRIKFAIQMGREKLND